MAHQAWAAVVAAADLAAVVAAAAGLVVVEAEVVVVEAEVAAVVDGDNKLTKGMAKMKSRISDVRYVIVSVVVSALTLSCLFFGDTVHGQRNNTSKGTGFATPQEAVDALVVAAEKYDETALAAILGPSSYDIIHSGEPARDKEMAVEFATQTRAKQSLTNDPRKAGVMILNVGTDDWPFPIPLVKVAGKWYFDTNAGREEILLRRIGRNELDAMEVCRGYVEAQYEYAFLKRENGVNQYAQRIISTAGKQDGLAWQNSDGTWDGPIGENVAKAIARGYTSGKESYRGYFFQVLKGQGPEAPMGQTDFLEKGATIGGFALIAAPAQYRNTGVKTFMVSHDGVIYEKDLGPNTLEIARRIDSFNPDKTWTPVLEK